MNNLQQIIEDWKKRDQIVRKEGVDETLEVTIGEYLNFRFSKYLCGPNEIRCEIIGIQEGDSRLVATLDLRKKQTIRDAAEKELGTMWNWFNNRDKGRYAWLLGSSEAGGLRFKREGLREKGFELIAEEILKEALQALGVTTIKSYRIVQEEYRIFKRTFTA